MKKLIIPALILALILSGCSFTEQLETVKTEYIDPAVEAAKNGESTRTDAEPEVSAPNVVTSRERLTDYVAFDFIYTRAQDELISQLKPSNNYGRARSSLTPFAVLWRRRPTNLPPA